MIIGHTYTTSSLEELDHFIEKEFLPFLSATDTTATVFGLTGDLGSGKTAFVKSVAKHLGITETLSSPTFIIAKSYTLPNENTPLETLEGAKDLRAHPHFHELIHIDAYRMENPEEADVLRLPSLLQDGRNLIFIEWPEMLGEHMPSHIRTIHCTFIDEATRTLSLLN
jgi:tRNA threonylcarbamoyladenosine biosynthesis protein TsaE